MRTKVLHSSPDLDVVQINYPDNSTCVSITNRHREFCQLYEHATAAGRVRILGPVGEIRNYHFAPNGEKAYVERISA